MNWTNVKLIFAREVRDQLRDRRMLFMMFVLPLLLYPMMGLSVTQLAQFLQEHPARVLLVGVPELAEYPALINPAQSGKKSATFVEQWLEKPSESNRFLLETPSLAEFEQRVELPAKTEQQAADYDPLFERARLIVDQEAAEVVIAFPANFAKDLRAFNQWVIDNRDASDTVAKSATVPKLTSPKIFCNTAKDKSKLALIRVQEVLSRWQTAIAQHHLSDARIPLSTLRPFEIEQVELAEDRQVEAAAWSKILPMMLIIWALTGAFYPAIDLCAGEKERGTLETLLCSPAARSEIVTGKILTVMLFSLLTSLLNLLSVGATGMFVMGQLQGLGAFPSLGMPPIESLVSMALALIPVSILFSALCVALASYARSNKEGQYYLMPLMLVVLPLVFLPMDPRLELSLGNALIPVTGLMLLLRHLLEGEYTKVLHYVAPVCLTTSICCWIAIRWAVDQFNREEVLFRESERFDLRLWLKQLFAEKRATPSVAMAIVCVVVMFIGKFFLETALAGSGIGQGDTANLLLTKMVLVPQLLIMLLPALLLTFTLTTNPLKTLLLASVDSLKCLLCIPLAVLLALLLHPTSLYLNEFIQQLYPISQDTAALAKQFSGLLENIDLRLAILLIAIVPAICEELAFRGFILSGLRQGGNRVRAIVLSAVFFGLIHGMLHQSLHATLLGLILGYIAVKTGSLWPCVAFHATNNATKLLHAAYAQGDFGKQPWLEQLLQPTTVELASDQLPQFRGYIILLGILSAGVILAWFNRMPIEKTKEETLWDQINDQRALELT